MKKILLITAMFMAMNTWSADYQVTDTVSIDTASKVCAITLKGKKQTVESEIFKYSCVKGDILYLTEVQLIGMKTSLIILSIFSLSVFSQNVISSDSEGLEEMATVIITRITKSGKEKNYLTSDSRIRLNNEEKRKFKRKPRMSFNVPEGQHTIYVTKLLTPGSSSVSFYAMPMRHIPLTYIGDKKAIGLV